MGSSWDIEYNQFLGLGRTRAIPLDVTALPHIGTNQIGKYAEHHHHVDSAVGSVDIGNVYQGNPNTSKWALSVHATSDALIQDCIEVDFPGAGFVQMATKTGVFSTTWLRTASATQRADNIELVDFQMPALAARARFCSTASRVRSSATRRGTTDGVNLFVRPVGRFQRPAACPTRT
jgi:hypothetical protein